MEDNCTPLEHLWETFLLGRDSIHPVPRKSRPLLIFDDCPCSSSLRDAIDGDRGGQRPESRASYQQGLSIEFRNSLVPARNTGPDLLKSNNKSNTS
jgi:hypothetical protein